MTDAYAKANDPWPRDIPPISTMEAMNASRALLKKFGSRDDAAPNASRRRIDYWRKYTPRKVWVCLSGETNTLRRGWRRLVHDISHIVYEYRYPRLDRHSAHSPIHAKLEAEMVRFVLDQGWLAGVHRPPAKPKPSPADRRTIRLAKLERRLTNWERKLRRAERAVRKLKRQIAATRRSLGA